jgi:hypothetical protein
VHGDRHLLTVNASAQSLGLTGPGTDYIARLGPGESHSVALAFSTDRKVPLGLRTIGATLDYVLPDGTSRRQNESFAVLVREAALGLARSTDPIRVDRGHAFTLSPGSNTGTDSAKSVGSDRPSVQRNNESFIGTIVTRTTRRPLQPGRGEAGRTRLGELPDDEGTIR